MVHTLKNNNEISLRILEHRDISQLLEYLHKLSPETRHYFGPHPFELGALINFYQLENKNIGFVACRVDSDEIIAYSCIKDGILEHDKDRLISFGLYPNSDTDCTFAPSVADEWQNCGVGNIMLHFIIDHVKKMGKKRMILWGGVKCDNHRAVHYYLKNGFKTLSTFEYYGMNQDMVLVF